MHYPQSTTRYTILSKMIMKSLSVETVSDSSKPIFFGDAINGYCLSRVFNLKDVNARGSERKYSLLVVSDSEMDILNNWDIVNLYFNEWIEILQQKVELELNKLTADSNNEKYLRRGNVKPKSLIELTNDQEIFIKVHLWASELIKDLLK
ncbi:unnamed protein product [Candida verbasci]|uniref:UDENN FLCN/SMCR8-type domain-containing protein n=1 Tax=Candida verbasci TaxID=1227364 RepID=A0A9W4TZA1_9ASCO|nr:unnamed protein product [Candida verbasci]